MEDLFNKIYSTEFLFEVFTGLDEGAINDYYALFISSMAYYKFIKIDNCIRSGRFAEIILFGNKIKKMIINKV